MRPSHTFRERLKGDPDNPQFHFTLGQALVEEGDFEQALVPLTYCLEVKEDWLDAQALMGRCYLELRLPQKAKLHLQQALDLSGHVPGKTSQEEIRSLLDQVEGAV